MPFDSADEPVGKVTSDRAGGAEPDFRALFQAAPGAYLVLAAKEGFPAVAASDAYLRATMRRRDEVEGRGIFAIFPDLSGSGDESPVMEASLRRVAEHGQPDEVPLIHYPLARPASQGGGVEERYWKAVNTPVKGPDGGVAYILHEAVDITAEVSLEGALEESEARLHFTLDAAGVGAWDLDMVNDTAQRSRRHDEIFGYDHPVKGWGYETFLRHVHPDDRARVSRALGEATDRGGDWEFECRIIRPDGEVRWIEAHGSPYAFADGRPVRMLGMVEDITERKATEEALRRSRDRFRSLVDATASIVWTAGPDGMVRAGSERWEGFTGQQPEEYEGMGWLDAVHPEDRDRVHGAGIRSVGGRSVGESHFRLRHRSGEYRYVEACGVPLRDEGGRVVEWIGTLTDIHDRKVAEKERVRLVRELESQRNRLRQVFEQAPAGIMVTRGPEHRIEIANPVMEKFLGERDLVGRTIREITGRDAHVEFADVRDRVYGSGEPYVGDEVCVVLDEDGGEDRNRFFNFVYQPLFDAEGKVEGILTVAIEVTDQVLARWELEDARTEAEEAREQIDSIVESVSDAFYAIDDDDRLVYVNREAERLWGRKRRDLLGRKLWEVFSQAVGGDSFRAHQTARRERRPVSVETFSTGLGRWLQIDIYPRDPGLTVFFRDVTERHEAEEERERLYREADEANRAKANFLAVMSHELRTPLNAVVGFTELLEAEIAGPVTDHQRVYLERIRAGTSHLIQIIEEILSFSRAEAGREEVRFETVDLGDIIRDTAVLVEPMAAEKGLAFEMPLSDDLPSLETDPTKLRQILLNLLSNAVKFTDEGRVGTRVAVEGDALRIAVFDTGEGIDPSEFERIFEPFRQVDQSSRRRAGGTGLGLAVTRHLVELLGGEIEVESRPQEGSVFTLSFPLHPEEDASRQ